MKQDFKCLIQYSSFEPLILRSPSSGDRERLERLDSGRRQNDANVYHIKVRRLELMALGPTLVPPYCGQRSPAGSDGHPAGGVPCTLVRILEIKGGRYGCAGACVDGDQGVATVIEGETYGW